MNIWRRLFGDKEVPVADAAKSAPSAPPEWREEFANRREAFIQSLRDAVAGTEVVSRVYDAEDGYANFSQWVDGKLASSDQGGLAEAEAFLRHLIDEGHKTAYAVSRDGTKSLVCVSYDCDEEDWFPVWPADFHVDATESSVPMTKDW